MGYLFVCVKKCFFAIQQKWRDDRFFQHMVYLYGFTFFVILPLICYQLPHSIYHIQSTNHVQRQEFERKINDKRIEFAENYFRLLNRTMIHGMLQSLQSGKDHRIVNARLDLVISIISVSRNRHRLDLYEPKYLSQVAATLLSLLNEAHSKGFPYSVKISLCNVDRDPKSYKEAQYLKGILPTYEKNGPHNKEPLRLLHTLEKEKEDYVYCIDESLKESNPRYILIIEDDALPHNDIFTIIEHTLSDHPVDVDENHQHQTPLYYKMFHPERLLSFISIEVERLPELVSYGATFGSFITLLYIISISHKNRKGTVLIWFILSLYVILVCLAVGRSNLLELRRIYPPYLYEYTPAPSCCTPAILFTNIGAHAISKNLSSITCRNQYGKDMAIADYMYETRSKAVLIQPNLVTHIGMYSSLRNVVLDPAIV